MVCGHLETSNGCHHPSDTNMNFVLLFHSFIYLLFYSLCIKNYVEVQSSPYSQCSVTLCLVLVQVLDRFCLACVSFFSIVSCGSTHTEL